MVRVDGKLYSNLFRSKRVSLLIPDIAGLDFPDGSGTDQLFKILPGLGKYLRAKLTDVRKKGLTIEGPQSDLVKHQMVDRCI